MSMDKAPSEFPQPVLDALERDAGIRIKSRAQQKLDDDNRFCYGATCTWFGSIHEISTTKKHPSHQQDADRAHELPCCPICGGMLFELQSEGEWWDGVDTFEKGIYPTSTAHPHPGYRAMLEWQREQKKCFRFGPAVLDNLVKAYKDATGTLVDISQ